MSDKANNDSRRVLVTGASRGIGRAIALRLAHDGFDLALNYLRSKALAESLAAEIEAIGRRAVLLAFDVADRDACAEAIANDIGANGAYWGAVSNAGVTADGVWKRLFPVRFRHLKGESSFSRWDWVKFDYRSPTSDRRVESCHVHEESIAVDGKLAPEERARFLNPLIVGSAKHAMEQGHSLGIIRPRNTRFLNNPKCAEISKNPTIYCLSMF